MHFPFFRGFPALFCPFWPGKFPRSTKPAPLFWDLFGRTGQHRPFPASRGLFPHPLQNRVPRGERAPVALYCEPTEPAGETKSFCPCHKTGENTGFSPVFFFHVLHGFVVHFGSDTGFSHPVLPVLNCSHPLQHPKRTRFRPFWPFPGAFFSFSLFFGCKIFVLVFVHFVA